MAQAAERSTPKAGAKASSGASSGTTSGAKARSTTAATNGSTSGATVKSAKVTPTTPTRAVSAPSTTGTTASAASTTGATGLRAFADRWGLKRLLQPLGGQATTGANGTGTAGTTKPRSGSFKFLLGMMIFIFAAEFLVYLLSFIDHALFRGALETTKLGTLPLLGTISPFFVLYILLTLGLWMALYRFNIIPKDPFGVKAQQAARPGSRSTASTTATVGRNRAARQASTTAVKETLAPRRTVSGPNDAVYQRVKAAQRSRKRRGAKR